MSEGTLPQPDPALKRLDRLVGRWSMGGHLVGSDETTITGETTFRWLPGGFFLEQHVEMNMMGLEIDSLELIGYDPETNTFPSTVFSNLSPSPLPYRWDIQDDTVTITVSYGPLDATFTGSWREDGTFSGHWRPNPGADETVNVPYDIGGHRLGDGDDSPGRPDDGRTKAGSMSNARQAPEAVLFDEDREPQPVLSIRRSVAVAELAQAQGESLVELWRSMQARGLASVGPPFVRYHTFSETETDLEVGVPVGEGATAEGRIEAGALPGGPAITTWHLGAHDRLAEAYGRFAAWIEEHEREAAGPAWEVYWWIDASREPDPSSWPAPMEWRTELVQPIA